MVLITHHNPLQGISFRVIGVASDEDVAKEVIKHYYAGHPFEWQRTNADMGYRLIKWFDKSAGVCYVIQEVEVF
jgi:hypothetical protein